MATKTVLVVDDEESIQLLYREELRDEGIRALSAFNGEEALALFKEAVPDLVILDVQMPGMTGIEVLRQMKMLNPEIPVVSSSAYADYKQDLGAWASDDYVVKSASISNLMEVVKRLITQGPSQPQSPTKNHHEEKLVIPHGAEKKEVDCGTQLDASAIVNNVTQKLCKLKSIINEAYKQSLNHPADDSDFPHDGTSKIHHAALLSNSFCHMFTNPEIDQIGRTYIPTTAYSVINVFEKNIRTKINAAELEGVSVRTDGELVEQLFFVILQNLISTQGRHNGTVNIVCHKEKFGQVEFIYEKSDALLNEVDLLIADDDPEILHYLEDTLQREGFSVMTASDAYDAFDMLRQTRFNAIILDYYMPGMDGLEALKTIRTDKNNHSMPIVIYSNSEEIKSNEFDRLIQDYSPAWALEKKEDPEELLKILSNIETDTFPSFRIREYWDYTSLKQTLEFDQKIGYGFLPAKKIASKLGIEVIVEELDNNEYRIVLNFPRTPKEISIHSDHLEHYNLEVFKEANSRFRHDLKNKLDPVVGLSKGNHDYIESIKDALSLLETIKDELE